MLQLPIKPKAIPQGFKKADVFAELLQIGSVELHEVDTKATISVALCTAQKTEEFERTETPNPDGSGVTVENIPTGKMKITGVGCEVYSDRLEYINPEYSGWVKDEDLINYVCNQLEVELL